MGKVFISLGGGGGVGSDELTATKADVLAGKSFVGSDTNDEIGTGSMVDKSGTTQEATATLDSSNKRVQLTVPVTGKYDTAAKLHVAYATLASLLGVEAAKMLTTETILGVQGTIPVRGSSVQANSSGPDGSYVTFAINPGYYTDDSSGRSWAYRPLSDFGGVPANKVVSGQTFTSTAGLKVTGTMAVTSAINFKATALSTTSIRISWTNPSQGPWEGVFIQMSTSGNPGVSGGSRVYTGRGNNGTVGGASNYVDITGLDPATTYYFTCTSYATGLGNGSSYNVSAKTTGMLIYWYGNNVAGIKGRYDNTSAFEEKGGYAYSYNNLGADYVFSIGSLNVSAYTKLKVRLRFTSWAGKYGSYFGMDLLQYNGTSYRDTSKSLSDTATVLTEYTLDISGVSSIPGFTIGQHYWNDNKQGWYMSDEPYYLYAMWCE